MKKPQCGKNDFDRGSKSTCLTSQYYMQRTDFFFFRASLPKHSGYHNVVSR